MTINQKELGGSGAELEQTAYVARLRFLTAMHLLGLEVTSGAVQMSRTGVYGIRLGVVGPDALDQVSELLEAHFHTRTAAGLLASRTDGGCQE